LISGSWAAFSMTVVPLASEAAITATWVAPTVTFGNTISPPRSPFGRRAPPRIRPRSRSRPELLERHEQQVDRARADGAAAGQRDRASPMRASSGAITQKLARIFETSS
jgi:hypothetical protein